MAKGKRKTSKKRKKKGKVVLKPTVTLINARANAGNIGYTALLPNAGVVRVKVKKKT